MQKIWSVGLAALAACLQMAAVAGDGPDETAALQARIDAAAAQGGGKVTLAAGDHHIASVILKSGVELHLAAGARLVGSRDPDAYALDLSALSAEKSVTRRWSNAMIRLIGARDVAVTGEPGSEICGRNCFDATGEEGFRGPHAITAFGVTNLVLSGYVVRDAGNFGIYASRCANIRATGVEVQGGHDGFDFFYSRDILVEKCRIFSGDDCVAGFGNVGLTVRDCEVNSSCSLFRLGGENVLVENCRGAAPGKHPHRWSLSPAEKRLEVAPAGVGRKNTLSVFTFFTSKNVPEPARNIVFRNCRFTGVERLLHYNLSGNERWQSGKGLADVTFENVTAEGLTIPLVAYGVAETPLALTLRGTALGFAVPVASLVRGANVGSIALENVTVTGVEGALMEKWQTAAPAVKAEGVKGVSREVKPATRAFVCRQI